VHEGQPDTRCELPGAFAELKLSLVGVYVTAARAAEADKATSSIGSAQVLIRISRDALLIDDVLRGALKCALTDACRFGERLHLAALLRARLQELDEPLLRLLALHRRTPRLAAEALIEGEIGFAPAVDADAVGIGGVIDDLIAERLLLFAAVAFDVKDRGSSNRISVHLPAYT
jgi:hypothetical protein